jgi:carboxymethylenebutenolidase
MKGEMVSFSVGPSTARGYLARPASGRGPGVVVIQEWWGLVDHIKDVADRFAGEGFVALAPDLYRGASASKPDDAGRLMMALNIDQAVKEVLGAADYLLGAGGASSRAVGVVGFCMGGQLALAAACESPKVGACVDFYGVHPSVKLDVSALSAPVLGLFGGKDEFVSPEVARKLEREVRSAGKRIEIHIYPDASHAFFNETRADVYNEGAAADAWRRALRFFRAHLPG